MLHSREPGLGRTGVLVRVGHGTLSRPYSGLRLRRLLRVAHRCVYRAALSPWPQFRPPPLTAATLADVYQELTVLKKNVPRPVTPCLSPVRARWPHVASPVPSIRHRLSISCVQARARVPGGEHDRGRLGLDRGRRCVRRRGRGADGQKEACVRSAPRGGAGEKLGM